MSSRQITPEEVVERLQTLEDRQEDLEAELDEERDRRKRLEARVDGAANNLDRLEDHVAALEDAVDDAATAKALSTVKDQLHRERSKLTRRVAALEDELGITAADALATAEAGKDATDLTKLGRLVRHGPEAVSDRPSEKMYRARELVDNWTRWGTVRDDSYTNERRLASKKHDLKTRLEDARGESLAWRQVYRAMELVEEWSGPNVTLQEGSEDEGKWVLVHELDVGGEGS